MSAWNKPTPALPSRSKGEGAYKGIGLIEVMVSIAIISIGVLGLISAFPFGSNAVKSMKDETIARELAQTKIEELSALTYENVAVGTLEDRVRLATSTADYLYNFTRSTFVELLDQNFAPTISDIGFKKITVTVYFPVGLRKQERAAGLVYLKSER